mmetsp:Transcript_1075/g.2455  ORF Transcript_1075/g.2455 Transcript_1075/m.2455 type:complete len:83 (-) Transcript_1075:2-250(-)
MRVLIFFMLYPQPKYAQPRTWQPPSLIPANWPQLSTAASSSFETHAQQKHVDMILLVRVDLLFVKVLGLESLNGQDEQRNTC